MSLRTRLVLGTARPGDARAARRRRRRRTRRCARSCSTRSTARSRATTSRSSRRCAHGDADSCGRLRQPRTRRSSSSCARRRARPSARGLRRLLDGSTPPGPQRHRRAAGPRRRPGPAPEARPRLPSAATRPPRYFDAASVSGSTALPGPRRGRARPRRRAGADRRAAARPASRTRCTGCCSIELLVTGGVLARDRAARALDGPASSCGRSRTMGRTADAIARRRPHAARRAGRTSAPRSAGSGSR